MPSSEEHRSAVEKLADEYLLRIRRGEKPTIEEYVQRHPDLADEIRELLPALIAMEDIRSDVGAQSSETVLEVAGKELARLDDYRILREVGRGGMGIVYEAEQLSLGRHVALKVLPAMGLLPNQLRRFQLESRIAARLHHTNIVPVFDVGEAEGVYFYVMQFISGYSIDTILHELKRLAAAENRDAKKQEPNLDASPFVSTSPLMDQLVYRLVEDSFTSKFASDTPLDAFVGSCTPPRREPVPERSSSCPFPRHGRRMSMALSGQSPRASSGSDLQYFRSVAHVGIQVAEALDCAHGQQIVHRDIKPSNLILDAQGRVWVTDFGLAKVRDQDHQAELTLSGDIVGTLPYMAPERFQGECDPRSDIYGLGATLYELIALKRAFETTDRNELMHCIQSHDPPALRRHRPGVPRDLETIVLKAMDRDKSRRYQTASDLAEDLQNFLKDRPIQARRASSCERFIRWCRRNPLVASLTAAVALLLIVITTGALFHSYTLKGAYDDLRAQQSRAETAERERNAALVDSILSTTPELLPYALETLMTRGGVDLDPLRSVLKDSSATPSLRLRAAIGLTILGDPQTAFLLQSLPTANGDECANLIRALRVVEPSVVEPLSEAARREKDPKVKTRIARLLLGIGEAGAAREMLAFAPDPTPRTTFLHDFSAWYADLAPLSDLLRETRDPAFQSGICLALGTIDPERLPRHSFESLRSTLLQLYVHSPSGVTHSAAGWALGQWGVELPLLEPCRSAPPGRDWFVNRLGMCLLEVPSGRFRMGDPSCRESQVHPVILTRPFFMLDREVSRALFEKFVKDPACSDHEKPAAWQGVDHRLSPSSDCPAQNVSWEDSLHFCNWLSRKEGRQPCYRRLKSGAWSWDVDADGYRLPTEAEWEHACRAGSETTFLVGDNVQSLTRYVNTSFQHTASGGCYMPNDRGFFDILGNAWEWCWDGYRTNTDSLQIDPRGEEGNSQRVIRGGGLGAGLEVESSWPTYLQDLAQSDEKIFYDYRSSRRHVKPATKRDPHIGFRVVCNEDPALSGDRLVSTCLQLVPSTRASRIALWKAIRRSCVQNGQLLEAEKMLARAVDEHPEDPAIKKEHALALADLGRWAKAGAELDAILSNEPRPEEDWVQSGWWVAGPYPRDIELAFEPEKQPGLPESLFSNARESTWRPAPWEDEEHVRLSELFDFVQHITAYAMTHVYSPRERELLMLIGSDDQVRVWLNDELVHDNPSLRIAAPDQDQVVVRFRPGWNRVLAKVVNHTDNHQLYLRFTEDCLTRSRVHSKNGDWQLAAQVLEEALQEDRNDTRELLRELGRILLVLQRREEARDIFSQALDGSKPEDQGWLTGPWWIVGPYPLDPDASYPPEHAPDPSMPVRSMQNDRTFNWITRYRDDDTRIDLTEDLKDPSEKSFYALTRVYSQSPQEIILNVASDDRLRVWLNGKLTLEHTRRDMVTTNRGATRVMLRSGWNELLVRTLGVRVFRLWLTRRQHGDLLDASDWKEDLADFMESDPKSLYERGEKFATLGEWSEARSYFRIAAEKGAPLSCRLDYALASLASGEEAAWRDTCRELFLELSASATALRSLLWVAALRGDPEGNASGLLRKALDLDDRSAFSLTVLGAVQYRAARFEAALETLRKAQRHLNRDCPPAYTEFFLSLVHSELGDADQAAACYEEAESWRQNRLRARETQIEGSLEDLTRMSWQQEVILEMLKEEAFARLGRKT